MKNIFLLLLLSFVTHSCLITKNYQKPELDVPVVYRDFKEVDSTSMASVPYELFFKDILLLGYIDEALINNYDLRLSLQNVYRSQALYQQGRAGYLPTLNVDATVTSSDFSDNSFQGQQARQGNQSSNGNIPSRIEQYDLTGTLDWEVDLWGGITSNKRATAAAYLQSEAGQRLVKTSIISNVASQYYLLMALDEQLETALKAVDARQRSYEITQKLKKAGLEREVVVQQSGSQLKIAELLALDLELQIKVAENAFSVLLGKNPQQISRSELVDVFMDREINMGLPSQLLRNRPDVIQAEFNLINAFELENVARADFYPQLNLGASAGFRSVNASNWISSASLFNSLVAGLAQPILNNRRIRTNYEVAQINKKTASLDFKQTLLNAYQEVNDAWFTQNSLEEQYKILQEQVLFLDNATDYSFRLYQSGLSSYLEVLIADSNRLNAQIELINLKLDQLNATVELYRALGGGWNKVIVPVDTMLSNEKEKDE
ncbi:efflux transporter, outer membrane factor (OMF) lipoprotein, NodT family [Nonlabens sp. Hel1_33_55]|uniref:efflux transporter outer membrane subunit n=1 Tax=Nonlabens sp. Hel1_33_55 TaxID=1336802 RepID=UPI000875B66D|nr:TolC family protein [Nonlabens sp. Hel1_33_55]SCY17105.1 efflux transporter, outer membrane factor (OMF) lipoprotein, NodT family [Nonlabens sp. Hel1_33_55]